MEDPVSFLKQQIPVEGKKEIFVGNAVDRMNRSAIGIQCTKLLAMVGGPPYLSKAQAESIIKAALTRGQFDEKPVEKKSSDSIIEYNYNANINKLSSSDRNELLKAEKLATAILKLSDSGSGLTSAQLQNEQRQAAKFLGKMNELRTQALYASGYGVERYNPDFDQKLFKKLPENLQMEHLKKLTGQITRDPEHKDLNKNLIDVLLNIKQPIGQHFVNACHEGNMKAEINFLIDCNNLLKDPGNTLNQENVKSSAKKANINAKNSQNIEKFKSKDQNSIVNVKEAMEEVLMLVKENLGTHGKKMDNLNYTDASTTQAQIPVEEFDNFFDSGPIKLNLKSKQEPESK